MQQMYETYKVTYFCKLFGRSRQAFYEQKKAPQFDNFKAALVIKMVNEIREDLPKCGVEKLHHMLQEDFIKHDIKLGRDGLNKLLGDYGLLVRCRKRRPHTSNSSHHYKKHPNLIKNKVLSKAGELWVSDITYIRESNKFSYLSIITDAYSHKIVGYQLYKTLESDGPILALMMASKDTKRESNLIHHSDRGIQYCCKAYVRHIEHLGIQLSMTEKGDPYENAIAERVNGILKTEFYLDQTFNNHEHAKEAVSHAIKMYNEKRIHDSCNRLTPIQAHEENGALKKYWRPKKYTQEAVEISEVE